MHGPSVASGPRASPRVPCEGHAAARPGSARLSAGLQPSARCASGTLRIATGASIAGHSSWDPTRHFLLRPMNWTRHVYEDIPGTYVFDGKHAHRAHPLNKLLFSFNTEGEQPRIQPGSGSLLRQVRRHPRWSSSAPAGTRISCRVSEPV
jgi:hypothetical protein